MPAKSHGKSNTRIYGIWRGIKRRCLNKNSKIYKNYGAKGIGVCDDWSSSFVNFYNWSVNNGYKENLSIDRVDNEKGYYPENCRWVISSVQASNKKLKITNKSGHTGIHFDKKRKRWRATVTFRGKYKQLGEFCDINDAITARNQYIDAHKLPHKKA